ncbi:MAG: hypothetical protein HY541_02390 [Deltaproteobacteria bacterium]|nr:hypothetical protein [Deltaproteobacteria bacterium]
MTTAIAQYGCGEPTTGKDGVFVADTSGDYTLSAVSDACTGDFATAITIEQDTFNLILLAETDGFADMTGTIDENDNITLEGALNNGNLFACDGTYTDDKFVVNCTIGDGVSCSVTWRKN